MKLVIVAGGTGGHIYPGLALAEEFLKKNGQTELLFVGTENGLEKELIAREGYQLKLIKGRTILNSLFGVVQALKILRRFRPQVLVSTGGYASLPVVVAAWLIKIPVFLLEQNVLPGRTNRLCRRLARQLFLSFAESLKYIDGLVTGNPVRRIISETVRPAAGDTRTVLVMGGSQGARRLNEAVLVAKRSLPPGIRLIHLVGKRDFGFFQIESAANYLPIPYANNINDYLAQADLVISRAGATAIAEFLVMGLPMVLIPYPFAADGHQSLNAQAVEAAGAARVILDAEFNGAKLLEIIKAEPATYAKMSQAARRLGRPDAAARIVNEIYARS